MKMRASLFVLCFSFCLPISTFAQSKTELPTVKITTVRPSLTPSLAILVSEHPDKEAVASLKRDLAAGTVQVALDNYIVNFTVAMWENMLIHLIVDWSDDKILVLPKDFFELSACKQNMAVEALGLVYNHLISLGDRQVETLSYFSSSGVDVEVNDNEEKELTALLNGFEKLAADNTDRFAKITFMYCQPAEMKSIFFNYGTAANDEKKWSAQTKKSIAEQFKEFRLMLQNR
jgi:hypothetical protein